ncbi:MAG: hypothetical protein ACOVOV_14760, partial [Dolichospermum sp.]
TGKTVINGTIYGQKNIIWTNTTYTFDGTESGALALFEISSDTACYLPFPSQIQNGYSIEIKNANGTAKQLTVMIQSDSVVPTYGPGDSTDPIEYKLNEGDANFFTYYNEFWFIH